MADHSEVRTTCGRRDGPTDKGRGEPQPEKLERLSVLRRDALGVASSLRA